MLRQIGGRGRSAGETADPGDPALALAAWMTQDAGDKVAATVGQDVGRTAQDGRIRAGSKRFRCRCGFAGGSVSKVREIQTRNVVAKVEGGDPVLKDQAVMFSAHWDHLGIGDGGEWAIRFTTARRIMRRASR